MEFRDPKVISHSVVALFTDMLWSRLAIYYFLCGRVYFLSTLVVFAVSASAQLDMLRTTHDLLDLLYRCTSLGTTYTIIC